MSTINTINKLMKKEFKRNINGYYANNNLRNSNISFIGLLLIMITINLITYSYFSSII